MWGCKGIKFEGDFSDIGYELYLIKKRYMEDRLDLRLTLGYDKSSKYGLTNVDKNEEGSDIYNPKVVDLFDFPVDI